MGQSRRHRVNPESCSNRRRPCRGSESGNGSPSRRLPRASVAAAAGRGCVRRCRYLPRTPPIQERWGGGGDPGGDPDADQAAVVEREPADAVAVDLQEQPAGPATVVVGRSAINGAGVTSRRWSGRAGEVASTRSHQAAWPAALRADGTGGRAGIGSGGSWASSKRSSSGSLAGQDARLSAVAGTTSMWTARSLAG